MLEQKDLEILQSMMKKVIQPVNERLDKLENSVTDLKLHLENSTDKNIQLLAENHVELVKKLNEAIPVANNNLAYEVKVSYLIEKVEKLERKVQEHESKIA